MNSLKNSVRLIGHIGAAPEVKTFENPDSGANRMVRFSLATNDPYVNKKGEKVDNTEWHNIVAWGKTAEVAEKFFQKGTEIALEGKLTTRSWEKDGEKRYITEIVMNEFTFVGKKSA